MISRLAYARDYVRIAQLDHESFTKQYCAAPLTPTNEWIAAGKKIDEAHRLVTDAMAELKKMRGY